MPQTQLLQRSSSPRVFRDGLLVLAGFALLYMGTSATHMLLVKHTIGFEAYLAMLADGP